jgi:N-acetyl-anhydromuramyl-L-alanine amidase AmpD
MQYQSLIAAEDLFVKEEKQLLSPFSKQVPGESLVLNGLEYTPPRYNYFYQEQHAKLRIVLHHTAGHLRSDMHLLTSQDRHVSAAYVIGRCGLVFNLFPSKFWSGHIGAGLGNEIGKNNRQDKNTIAIELCNIGYLVKQGSNLETIYSRSKQLSTGVLNPIDIYCSIEDKAAYAVLNETYRDQKYFAKFTDAQINSLIVLIRYLTKVYKIPRQFLPLADRYKTTSRVLDFEGIVSHVNYRSKGKWDIGPAFNWQQVIDGVCADHFSIK